MSRDLRRKDQPPYSGVRDALRALPEEAPPPEVWDRVRQRSGLAADGSPWLGPYPLAMAAGVFLAAVIGVVLFRASPADNPLSAELEELIATSQRLESNARETRPSQIAWSSTRQALVYRIAGVDRELNQLVDVEIIDADMARELWQQRVALLASLIEVEREERHQDEYVVF